MVPQVREAIDVEYVPLTAPKVPFDVVVAPYAVVKPYAKPSMVEEAP